MAKGIALLISNSNLLMGTRASSLPSKQFDQASSEQPSPQRHTLFLPIRAVPDQQSPPDLCPSPNLPHSRRAFALQVLKRLSTGAALQSFAYTCLDKTNPSTETSTFDPIVWILRALHTTRDTREIHCMSGLERRLHQ